MALAEDGEDVIASEFEEAFAEVKYVVFIQLLILDINQEILDHVFDGFSDIIQVHSKVNA